MRIVYAYKTLESWEVRWPGHAAVFSYTSLHSLIQSGVDWAKDLDEHIRIDAYDDGPAEVYYALCPTFATQPF